MRSRPLERTGEDPSAGPDHVLLVEDLAELHPVARRVLENAGLRVTIVRDAHAARAFLGADEGATVDFVERVNESGFEVRPVKRTETPAASAPTGPVADRVREVLDDQVNPAIASHGGAINLVDVQGTELYLEMSGGCQGCAMSRLTLRQGVERMLRQAIPELTAVHDITDHASGVNPYFQA